jgi:Zn-dependent peptidase ImmA (M78 family)
MASKRNKYLDRICEFVGVVDPARAIQALVERYQEAGRGVRSVAASLGVARIVEEPMSVDGAVLVDGEHGLTIKINSRCGAERRKFTLAHEVAHLLLSEVVHGQAPCRRGRPLEDACDAIAAELLMPAEEAVPFVKRQGESSPEKLRLIAEAFGVSLHVAALRVHEDFKLWRRSIGLWHFQGSARELWFVGKRRWRTTRPPFRAFEDALMSSTAIEARESFWEEGSVKPVCIELLSLGNQHLLGLVA